MSKNFLGLEITPTSVAWSVVSENDGKMGLVKSGVRTFKDAVDHTNSGEVSSASVRTGFRSVRKQYRRDRYRRILLLSALSEYGFCPKLSAEELRKWKDEKIYPDNDALKAWMNVNASEGKDPYADRHECLHRKLDLSIKEDRYMLGRAIYHLSSRRGYVDDKNDVDVKTKGKVVAAINALSDDMAAAGCEWLGDYFYSIKDKEAIRRRYISRTRHIEPEFNAICELQGLDADVRTRLHDIVFWQRPLKSQKYSVGRCVYIPSKFRCKTSHPLFEEFRLLSTLGNIKLAGPGEDHLRPLNEGEKEGIMRLFFRKSKPEFDFVEIAAELADEKRPKTYSGKALGAWRFNYQLDQSVPGCPVTAAIITALGDEANYLNWREVLDARYIRKNGNALQDLWHTLEFFTDSTLDRQTAWLKDNFGMEEHEARVLAGFPMPKPYAAMSAAAMSRILPFLREGLNCYDSVLLAGIADCVPDSVKEDAGLLDEVVGAVRVIVDDYRNLPREMKAGGGVENQVRDYLLSRGYDADRMWLPGAMAVLAPVYDKERGVFRLGSPISSSLRNPLVMRCLVQAGQVINALLDDGVIDSSTAVRFVCNREINTANMRRAIQKLNKRAGDERDAAIDAIEKAGADVTEDSILRYLLWEEQGRLDILSGDSLSLVDALSGSVTTVDRIVPASLGGGDGRVNRILTANANAENHSGARVATCFDTELIRDVMRSAGWEERLGSLEKKIHGKTKAAKSASTKKDKDKAITDRHVLEADAEYLQAKRDRILYTDFVDDADSLLTGRYGSIGKYMKKYLLSVFSSVSAYGYDGVEDICRMWGLKDRGDDYAGSMKSAVAVACIGKGQYDAYCRYRRDADANHAFGRPLEPFAKPWESFAEDVENAAGVLLCSRRGGGALTKESVHKLRDSRGRILRGRNGRPLVSRGDTVRGALHKATFYGKIMCDGQLVNVVRKPLDETFEEKDVKAVVDEGVRRAIMEAIERHGSLTEAIKAGIHVNGCRFPMRHVRVKTFQKNSFVIKEHQQKSRFEYKNGYYVMNDDVVFMVIRNLTSADPKVKSFESVNAFDAVRDCKEFGLGEADRIVCKDDCVLFYEKSMDELKGLSRGELSKRLHRVAGLGRQMHFRHHLDRKSNCTGHTWTLGGERVPAFILSYNKYPFAVEGRDFLITKTGDIKFLF